VRWYTISIVQQKNTAEVKEMLVVKTEDSCGSPTRMSDVVYPEVWRDCILDLAEATNMPITARVDQVRVGKGFAGIGTKPLPCVVVAHRDKPNKYLKIVGALDQMGTLTYASKYLAGSSSSIRNMKAAAAISNGMRAATGDGSSFLAGVFAKLSQRGQHTEQMYYDAVNNLMQEALDMAVGQEPLNLPEPPVAPPPLPVTPPAPQKVTPPPAPAPTPRKVTPPPTPKPTPAPKPVTPPPAPSKTATPPAQKKPAQAKPQAGDDKIIFICPKCKKVYRTAKKPVRVQFTCKQCAQQFTVDCSRSMQ
jgi:hypothetical protein